MNEDRATTLDLVQTHIRLADGPGAQLLTVNDSFWASLGERPDLQAGRLVGIVRMTEDWSHWEMHPAGDEILLLLSGAMTLLLEENADDNRSVELGAGQAMVVPRGIWHRGLIRAPGDLLFVTRGEGTRHRPA